MPDDSAPLLCLDGVTKTYGTKVKTEVLHGIDLTLKRGEFTALIGPSGSGKSTLLNQIGLLDRPSSGSIRVHGRATESLSDPELTRLRNEVLGFVFQFHHLIGAMNTLQNLMMPLGIRDGGFRESHREKARQALLSIGLSERETARPDELSGGQQQRVAIARALIHEPHLVLADEPTGNLDSRTADSIFSLLRNFNRDNSTAFLIVTHDPGMARRCDRVIAIEDGRIVSDAPPEDRAEGPAG